MINCFDVVVIKKRLNLFLLTYDAKDRSPIDIFNDFTAATKTEIRSSYVPEFLEYIRDVKSIGIEHLVLAAETDNIIPNIIGQLKQYKEP